MTWLSDSTLDHLRAVADRPDLSGTKYELLDMIARGGMGAVYRAKDRDLDRDVAVKVLSVPEISVEAASRMAQEARIIARLEHPGIVPVHDVGTLADGRLFYVMKLVRGSRLDDFSHRAGAIADRIRIFERLCEAVAFAHRHHVIHRDLKPENIMVGPFGEVLVMDWGVARLLSEEAAAASSDAGDLAAMLVPPRATMHGTVIGTPGYMAPEQVQGWIHAIDERTDVYALGAILWFLLGGDGPPALTSAAKTVSRPLKAIYTKAMAGDPDQRYQRVEDLAADVSRFVAGLPIEAYREGPIDRTLRFGRTYRTGILLVGAYLVMRALLLLFM